MRETQQDIHKDFNKVENPQTTTSSHINKINIRERRKNIDIPALKRQYYQLSTNNPTPPRRQENRPREEPKRGKKNIHTLLTHRTCRVLGDYYNTDGGRTQVEKLQFV